ncbi:diguanylate cyclase/phosphodiesterase (GGDEF & EAL domains) with PAS/PAC sensor(s) [Labilithrix luteola]|uniref:Diguanylate cyclase/phosphodiesterase (GGDEF & EAL domains) with PAS/PAC sensor(S) n=2 Tax=Labilithrix luteola TaxID=1391654 RepID=A0A0K1PMM9_9BACT|nr:diguanylate cyclase/phosphodiesterase (GGDEF & EAL domains) with PAS/PAC sensor(s) [Labilithrix luteola]
MTGFMASTRELQRDDGRRGDGSPEAAKPRLLLVEDDDALRRSLVRILRREYAIDEAADGQQAVEKLTNRTFDVVLSDINLPHASGVDLLRKVRDYDLDVPVILMTGQPSIETAIQAVDLGAFTYLRKPFENGAVEQALSRASKLGRLARIKREALTTGGDGAALAGDRAGLTASFERALDTLWLAFQPILDGRTQRTVGFEALMRCKEPSMPTPGAVLEAAERLDRIHELGRRVRERVAASFVPPAPDGMIFVNLHAAELSDPELYSDKSPLSQIARHVVLEITERSALEDVAETRDRAAALRKLGYRIAIDDLGAGYAGLTSFANLEPEVVKLDMSLVRGIEDSPVRYRIVEGITDLCRSLSMKVVAEGIETLPEFDQIQQLGCDYLQGYLFGRPKRALVAGTQRA